MNSPSMPFFIKPGTLLNASTSDNSYPSRLFDQKRIMITFPSCFSPAGIYLFKVNNKNTRKICEIHSKITKTPKRHHRLGHG